VSQQLGLPSDEPNRVGRVTKGSTDKQMKKGISGLADDLQRESERIAAIEQQI
jgi:hypothetical protein